jgi:hypothetical protein
MKFRTGAEFRFATPKYERVWGRLLRLGFFLLMLSFCVVGPTREWILGGAWLLILAALLISLVGAIQERTEWEAKQRVATK